MENFTLLIVIYDCDASLSYSYFRNQSQVTLKIQFQFSKTGVWKEKQHSGSGFNVDSIKCSHNQSLIKSPLLLSCLYLKRCALKFQRGATHFFLYWTLFCYSFKIFIFVPAFISISNHILMKITAKYFKYTCRQTYTDFGDTFGHKILKPH